jgi:integrase
LTKPGDTSRANEVLLTAAEVARRAFQTNALAWSRHLIEFNGAPIGSIDKAFAANVDAAGLGTDVVIHTLRHTAITWLAIEGIDVYEILRFGGITMEVFENVYAHHHPDHMKGVAAGFNRHRNRHRYTVNEREQTPPNVAKIADYSGGD